MDKISTFTPLGSRGPTGDPSTATHRRPNISLRNRLSSAPRTAPPHVFPPSARSGFAQTWAGPLELVQRSVPTQGIPTDWESFVTAPDSLRTGAESFFTAREDGTSVRWISEDGHSASFTVDFYPSTPHTPRSAQDTRFQLVWNGVEEDEHDEDDISPGAQPREYRNGTISPSPKCENRADVCSNVENSTVRSATLVSDTSASYEKGAPSRSSTTTEDHKSNMPLEPGIYYLVNVEAGLTMDLCGSDKAPIRAVSRNENESQKWEIIQDDQGSSIRSALTGRYISADDTKSGAYVTTSHSRTFWEVIKTPQPDVFRFRWAKGETSDLRLSIKPTYWLRDQYRGVLTDKVHREYVQLHSNDLDPRQDWRLIPVSQTTL